MSLAWVQAIVALFVALMVSLTGLLTSTAILLPVHSQKAEKALEKSRVNCFFGGLLLIVPGIIGVALLSAPLPILKVFGIGILLFLSALAAMGGAGMALIMGKRISEMSGAKTSFGALVRGSIAFSVGTLFPFVGWYVLAPLALLCAVGAGVAALWPARNPNAYQVPNSWQPQPAFAGASMMPSQQAVYPTQQTPANPYVNTSGVPAMHLPQAQQPNTPPAANTYENPRQG